MIEVGTYYPNEAGAKTLRDARPLHVDGKRVSVEVSKNEVTLFVGGDIKAVEGPSRFGSVSDLYEWAQQVSTRQGGEWTIEGPETNPGGFWIVRRPDGSKYGQALSEAGARIMRSQGRSKGIGHAWRGDTLYGPQRRRASILKNTERLAVQKALGEGASVSRLAREYGVSEATIARYRVDHNYRP